MSKINIDCEKRIGRIEGSLWGDEHSDKGLSGNVCENNASIKKLENAYIFGLGSMATINFIIGLYGIFHALK